MVSENWRLVKSQSPFQAVCNAFCSCIGLRRLVGTFEDETSCPSRTVLILRGGAQPPCCVTHLFRCLPDYNPIQSFAGEFVPSARWPQMLFGPFLPPSTENRCPCHTSYFKNGTLLHGYGERDCKGGNQSTLVRGW